MLWQVFVTTTLPTGTSVASSRGEEGLLAALRHGDPAHRCLSGSLAWQDCLEPVSNRALTGAPAGFWHGHIAHKPLRASRRGEAVFWPVLGTVPPPTGTSVASPRGETVIYRHFEEATDAGERQKSNAKWEKDRKGSGKRIVGKEAKERFESKGIKKIDCKEEDICPAIGIFAVQINQQL